MSRASLMRVCAVVLSIALLLSVCPISSVSAASGGTCGENVFWEVESGVLTISGTGEMTDYEHWTETPWYGQRDSITSAVVEYGVTSIGDFAFSYLTRLRTIEIPDSATAIGYQSFRSCYELYNPVIPSSVNYIEEYAFVACESITTISIPYGVASIGATTFDGCSGLVDVSIPDTVTYIGPMAFSNCESMRSITIPKSVTQMASNAFLCYNSTSNLTDIYYLGTEEEWNEINILDYSSDSISPLNIHFSEALVSNEQNNGTSPNTDAEREEEILMESDTSGDFETEELLGLQEPIDGCNLMWSFDESTGTLTISGFGQMVDFETIEARPWAEYVDAIIKIVVEDGVTSIGNNAFNFCYLVDEVSLPQGMTRIGDFAFSSCSALTSISIPNGVVSIGGFAFNYCFALSVVEFPDTLQAIGSNAFDNCASLSKIDLPEGLVRISSSAFYNCGMLEYIFIPASVTEIEEAAFQYCGSLENVYVSDLSTHYSSIDGVLFDKEQTELVYYPAAKTDAAYSIPSTVESISPFAFDGANALRSIDFPKNLTYIGFAAFWNVSLLEINYFGTSDTWNSIYIDEGNETLNDVRVYFLGTDIIAFSDVPESAWYHDTVYAAADAGIIAGNTDGTFEPNESLSWAQAVTFAVRLAQYNAGEHIYGAADQTDIWYEIYVDYALNHGIISDVPANPNGAIARGNAAVIFAAILGITNTVNRVTDGYFTDVPPDAGSYDAIYELARAGICNGKGGGVFGVNDTFLRSEVATIVARMAGLVEPAVITDRAASFELITNPGSNSNDRHFIDTTFDGANWMSRMDVGLRVTDNSTGREETVATISLNVDDYWMSSASDFVPVRHKDGTWLFYIWCGPGLASTFMYTLETNELVVLENGLTEWYVTDSYLVGESMVFAAGDSCDVYTYDWSGNLQYRIHDAISSCVVKDGWIYFAKYTDDSNYYDNYNNCSVFKVPVSGGDEILMGTIEVPANVQLWVDDVSERVAWSGADGSFYVDLYGPYDIVEEYSWN